MISSRKDGRSSDRDGICFRRHFETCFKERVKKRKWLETREAVDLIKGIFDGMSAAHGQADGCIIHRDLKPVNIMLAGRTAQNRGFRYRGNRIVDRLPTGALREDLARRSAFIHVPGADARRQLDHRSDLFNVGLIAFLLLGRRHPFADEALLFQLSRNSTRWRPSDSSTDRRTDDRASKPSRSGFCVCST